MYLQLGKKWLIINHNCGCELETTKNSDDNKEKHQKQFKSQMRMLYPSGPPNTTGAPGVLLIEAKQQKSQWEVDCVQGLGV